jgi:23S rRNA pseudouridine2604 synthase
MRVASNPWLETTQKHYVLDPQPSDASRRHASYVPTGIQRPTRLLQQHVCPIMFKGFTRFDGFPISTGHAATRTQRSFSVVKQNGPRRKQAKKHTAEVTNNKTSDTNQSSLIRLSKRMSELDLCSRREADKFILESRVLLRGNLVEPIMGQKVPNNEVDIVLLDDNNSSSSSQGRRPGEFSWSQMQTAAVVLHKPVGYVSGQPDESKDGTLHTPAVRLLTPYNTYLDRSTYTTTTTTTTSRTSRQSSPSSSVNEKELREAQTIVNKQLPFQLNHSKAEHATLSGYVPAGRLDLESAGLLLFTNEGVLAKKCIAHDARIEKEYYVLVEPTQSLTRAEINAGMTEEDLPSKPSRDLAKMRRGGFQLFGEARPLKPVVAAQWIPSTRSDAFDYFGEEAVVQDRRRVLRLVLKEGRKHQVRRMCREMLGMHVLQLIRTRIGSIELKTLPEGKWRPLRQDEVRFIYES